jgi:hypothetical protein
MKLTSAGSSKKPFSSPLSAWSKNRTHSWRKPIAGPGAPASGPVCPHGPISPRTGASTCSTMRSTMSRYPSAQPPTANTGHAMSS